MARAADLDGISAIERASFGDPWSDRSLLTSIEEARIQVLVAEVGTGPQCLIVGFVVALMLDQEAEIADIAVAPDRRQCGAGGMLLDGILDAARTGGIREVHLEVREANDSARRLYRSRGFVEVGRRRGYYRSPVEDALILRLQLDR